MTVTDIIEVQKAKLPVADKALLLPSIAVVSHERHVTPASIAAAKRLACLRRYQRLASVLLVFLILSMLTSIAVFLYFRFADQAHKEMVCEIQIHERRGTRTNPAAERITRSQETLRDYSGTFERLDVPQPVGYRRLRGAETISVLHLYNQKVTLIATNDMCLVKPMDKHITRPTNIMEAYELILKTASNIINANLVRQHWFLGQRLRKTYVEHLYPQVALEGCQGRPVYRLSPYPIMSLNLVRNSNYNQEPKIPENVRFGRRRRSANNKDNCKVISVLFEGVVLDGSTNAAAPLNYIHSCSEDPNSLNGHPIN